MRSASGSSWAELGNIDERGNSRGVWMPETNGTVKGEEGALRLGLDFRACPPKLHMESRGISPRLADSPTRTVLAPTTRSCSDWLTLVV